MMIGNCSGSTFRGSRFKIRQMKNGFDPLTNSDFIRLFQ